MLEAGRDLDALVAEKVMGETCLFTAPAYSTDIAAAWQVVDKLHALSFYLEVGSAGWMARFANISATEASAATAPLAICLAALKAVGVTVPE